MDWVAGIAAVHAMKARLAPPMSQRSQLAGPFKGSLPGRRRPGDGRSAGLLPAESPGAEEPQPSPPDAESGGERDSGSRGVDQRQQIPKDLSWPAGPDQPHLD